MEGKDFARLLVSELVEKNLSKADPQNFSQKTTSAGTAFGLTSQDVKEKKNC